MQSTPLGPLGWDTCSDSSCCVISTKAINPNTTSIQHNIYFLIYSPAMCFSSGTSHQQAVHKKYRDETSQLQSIFSQGWDLTPVMYNLNINIKKMAGVWAVHHISGQTLSYQINSLKEELRFETVNFCWCGMCRDIQTYNFQNTKWYVNVQITLEWFIIITCKYNFNTKKCNCFIIKLLVGTLCSTWCLELHDRSAVTLLNILLWAMLAHFWGTLSLFPHHFRFPFTSVHVVLFLLATPGGESGEVGWWCLPGCFVFFGTLTLLWDSFVSTSSPAQGHRPVPAD